MTWYLYSTYSCSNAPTKKYSFLQKRPIELLSKKTQGLIVNTNDFLNSIKWIVSQDFRRCILSVGENICDRDHCCNKSMLMRSSKFLYILLRSCECLESVKNGKSEVYGALMS
jgi:hypothetical protein